MAKISKSSRICIVGAGPSGLSVGYYLQKAGYTDVTILEKLPEVGGLCNSITYEQKSFDLGANYLTPAYKKTLAIAKDVGAKLYTETKAICYDPKTDKYRTILQHVTKNASFFSFAWQSLRYFIERKRAQKHLPVAGFAGVSQHPEIACTFKEWLKDKKLTALEPLFEIPISLMGYGRLDEIPAPYALTYMSIPTFWNMLVFGAGLPTRWPKRFIYGFQRFWQKVSWNLTVIKSAEIKKIERGNEVIIHFDVPEHNMNDKNTRTEVREFDYLIVAVPLTFNIVSNLFSDKLDLGKPCSLTDQEKRLFGKVVTNPYCMTTFIIKDLSLKRRLINILPVQKIGYPYVVTQQFPGNPLVSFYSRTTERDQPDRKGIIAAAEALILKWGRVVSEDDLFTHDRWTYFPHVPVLAIKEGFYDELEAMQGKNNTFYVGGLMAFELIEPILNYSENLVKVHFTGKE
ncbi:NAD(P)-binding protein [Algoriphagus boritolerans]|uniref:NAD(P)-binding Rossmann-like domain-containing protein n=1 Tax=Algoriphagus boritolerans DSM 17298 = JCM 18970 TaxID=1120964 RepID=A0A1H5WEA4_9BACT|nr:NAD(P)-binding protein [Algoriphagus boritolerans]SEF97919.1 NAD(P)-binding Rossmann-like domain-containing protein [Algoriphagus boritolerans DSM 17298 = JCM 18970]